ncbi:MAG: hypothetical protein IJI22_00250 [Bacilli bacterium]|nr:hypothetical protein [Bacilli bacterium]
MAKLKKLSSNDINKNSSVQVSHSINKIKENELKYTIILVIIFMVVFAFAGYISLRVSNDYINDKVFYNYNLAFSTNSVTLTNRNILSDENGLKSKGVNYTIKNSNNIKYKYRILLQSDDLVKEKCGCDNEFDYNRIKYSLDGVNVLQLNEDMVVSSGEITKDSVILKEIKFWISDDVDLKAGEHFHAKLVLEELK